jgi:hypothetical protein
MTPSPSKQRLKRTHEEPDEGVELVHERSEPPTASTAPPRHTPSKPSEEANSTTNEQANQLNTDACLTNATH